MQTGDDYFDSKEFREILSTYEESVKSSHPSFMDVDDLVDIADYYNYIGQNKRAKNVIDYALDIYPGSTLPLAYKAREALAKEDITMAKDLAASIIDKNDPDYIYLKAEILIAQSSVEEADNYLRQYLEETSYEEREDVVLDVVNLYLDYGLNDKAYEWTMRSMDTNHTEYKELLGRTLFGMGRFSESADVFNELIDRNPYSKKYWNALANAQFMNDNFNDSITSSEYAIAIDPDDPEGILSKANGLYRLENYDEALKYYERYNQIVKADDFGLLSQGICLVNMSRYEDALNILKEAEKKAHKDSVYLPQIYQEMAFAYSNLKEVEKAMECIDNTRKLDCDHLDMTVLKGHICLENNRKEDAEKYFQKAIADSGQSPDIILRIIVSMYDNNYLDASYLMFRKFFKMVSKDYNDGYSYMALCCWDMKKTKEFLFYLRHAVSRNPKEAKNVLCHIFPKDMEVKDYYDYMLNQLNSNT